MVNGMNDDEINNLIEASSLGTPTAKAFRDSVSDEDGYVSGWGNDND